MGPFEQYVEPGVYTRTLSDSTIATLTGGIRIPLLIGVGSETLTINDYEVIRGSSSTNDNYMTNEDVSSQFTGLNRTFIVSKFPIVDGTGKGTITKDPSKLTVTINGEPVGVSKVIGLTGEVTLSSIPRIEDTVKVNYFFKRTDTKIGGSVEFPEWDNLSTQANGVNKDFKVDFVPIVDGTNGGIPTTNIAKVTVTVQGPLDIKPKTVEVTGVHGAGGIITLKVAPKAGDIVLASYYTNNWMDTFDYLPVNNITNVIRVGTAPGRVDYINTLDFVVDGNKIQWGNSWSLQVGDTTANTTAIDKSIFNSQIVDNRVYMRPCTGVSNGTNTSFILEYIPTNGSGKGTPSDDIHTLVVYVGAGVQDAIAKKHTNPEKSVVLSMEGNSKSIVLKHAPDIGEIVYVTYYHNMIADDLYTVTCKEASVPGVSEGIYHVDSANNGAVYDIVVNRSSSHISDPNFSVEGPTFPDGHFDGQTIPGYSKDEEAILVHFMNHTDYLVLSSIGAAGTNGSGSLGQTYIDERTGTRFTLLAGSTVVYQPGDLLELDVLRGFKTSQFEKYAITGLKTIINNLTGVDVDNKAMITTYNKSGNEPSVGDIYYFTAEYAKTEYPIKVYTKLKDVVSDIGAINTDNRLSLAAYLAFSNGAIALGLAQVLRDNTGVDALSQSYLDILSIVESPIKNTNVKPNFICPITTKQDVINEVRIHCEKLSTIRYKSERTAIFGFAVGTTPEKAQQFVKNMNSERLMAIYPDGAIVGLVDELGNVNEAVVDGSFLAAAVTGLAVNPIYDVATPLTHKTVTGFRRLVRTVDAVTMNQTAVAGVTILEDLTPNLLIRQAMTTNPYSVLTREPSVIFIKDYVQQQVRTVLAPFIGVKLLPSVIQDIETTLNNLLNQIVNLEIITAFTGTSVTQDENDPTILNVETFYSPVLPLNWISVTMNLRMKL